MILSPFPVTTGNLQLHAIIGECKQSASFNLGNYGDISMLNQGRSQEETTTEANTRSVVRNQPYEIF